MAPVICLASDDELRLATREWPKEREREKKRERVKERERGRVGQQAEASEK